MQGLRDSIYGGIAYLQSRIENGLCHEYHQLRHGPSWAWTTACVGSSLAEFGIILDEMIEAVLSLQRTCGGWSYNNVSLPDADSTLRVVQFLQKVGQDKSIAVINGLAFVSRHQQPDGGFATYLPETLREMDYHDCHGWTESHPCVTALAVNVLSDCAEKKKATSYLYDRLTNGDLRSYWWQTPLYVAYEAGQPCSINGNDTVNRSLSLLLKAKWGIADSFATQELSSVQYSDGSFPESRVFRIPRPHISLTQLTGEEEVVIDYNRILSTSAAIVALQRQGALLC